MPDYTPEQFVKHIEQTIAKKRNSLMDVLVAEFLDTVCKELPLEEAHARQAFITAADQVADQLYQSGRIERTAERHRTTASGDPEAEKAGKGSAKATKTSLKVSLDNRLSFVKALEYGLPITVGDRSGNRGPKGEGMLATGSLYSPRNQGMRANAGIPHDGNIPPELQMLLNNRASDRGGYLMWMENGKMRYALERTLKPHGFFAKAIAAVKAKAKQYTDKGAS